MTRKNISHHDPWICEHCSKTEHGDEWNGWRKLPDGWLFCDVTHKGEPYTAVACSVFCMRAADMKMTQTFKDEED